MKAISKWLDRQACNYLERRGRTVLPYNFVGVAMGCATGTYVDHGDGFRTYTITAPVAPHIVLNFSMLMQAEGSR